VVPLGHRLAIAEIGVFGTTGRKVRLRRFATEEACRWYLFSLRWPEGFVCPQCSGREAWMMERGLWLCRSCRKQVSVTAGTIFQDSRVPLMLWFRAIWYLTTQKNGVSALGLQRVPGLGSYKTAWALLHKLRRAMVRPGRERLSGLVEVDEAFWGGEESGVRGRRAPEKILLLVAAEADGEGIAGSECPQRRTQAGRVCMALSGKLLSRAVRFAPTDTTIISVWKAMHMTGRCKTASRKASTFSPRPSGHLTAEALVDGNTSRRHQPRATEPLPRRVHLRFNRRKSAWRGKLFYRLIQQAAHVQPAPFRSLVKPQSLGDG